MIAPAKRASRNAAALALLALLFACEPPESKLPLSSTPLRDATLVGTWAGWLEDDHAVLHVFAQEKEPAWLDLVLVEDGTTIQFEGYPTRSGTRRFLNLRPKRYLDAWGDKKATGANWIFVRYDFAKNGALTLSYVDDEAAKKAITTGKLQATEAPDDDTLRASRTVLTSGTSALLAFVNATGTFKPLGTFKKQKLDPGPKR